MTENKTGDITILGPINNRIKKGMLDRYITIHSPVSKIGLIKVI